mgnify:CR=1 FL=1
MKKRILALLMAGALALGLTACGTDKKNANNTTVTATHAEIPTPTALPSSWWTTTPRPI